MLCSLGLVPSLALLLINRAASLFEYIHIIKLADMELAQKAAFKPVFFSIPVSV
jgi:hypothetical protein